MPSSKFRFEIFSPAGRIADISTRARSRRFELVRNAAGTVEAKFDFWEMLRLSKAINMPIEQIFAEGINEVYVYRKNVKVMGARIDYLSFGLGTETITVDVKASGFLNILKDRYTTEELTLGTQASPMSQTEIMGELLQYANDQMATGLTRGAEPTSTLRQRLYPKDKNIREAIMQLSEVNGGPDFNVTPEKVMDTYNIRIGVDRPDVVFKYGGKSANVLNLQVNRDATNIANQIFLRGEGQDADQTRATVSDATSQTKYGLRQRISDYSTITTVSELEEHGQEELHAYANPVQTIELTVDGNKDPQLGQYNLGDIVRVQVPRIDYFSRLNISRFRVDKINVTVDDNDSETTVLTLGKP